MRCPRAHLHNTSMGNKVERDSPVDEPTLTKSMSAFSFSIKKSKSASKLASSPSSDSSLTSPKKKISLEDFELLKVIGRGAFGKVMQVRKKDSGKIYAMKVLSKSYVVFRKQVDHTKTEKSVMSSIKHPFLVHLRFSFQNDTKLFMVMDYYNGGEMFYHLRKEGKFSEARTRFYIAELVLALEQLHGMNILYRDLVPAFRLKSNSD